MTEALLDSGATGLVMSEEFARRHKFKRTKLEKLVYVRNVNGTLNYAGPIVDTVEVEIFFKGHKEWTSIDVIGGQKWSGGVTCAAGEDGESRLTNDVVRVPFSPLEFPFNDGTKICPCCPS